MKFDPTKPVQTRDGHKARIVCTNRRDEDYPIVALIEIGSGEIIDSYTRDGRCCVNSGLSEEDLINMPEDEK